MGKSMTPADTHALKDSALCPWRTKSAKHQERMCDRVSVAGPCRDVPKLGVQEDALCKTMHWLDGFGWHHTV